MHRPHTSVPTIRSTASRILAPCALLLAALVLAACSGITGKTETLQDVDQKTTYKHGSVLGGEGGLSLFGPKRRNDAEQGSGGIGVNSFLWRASLDTLAFMPIVSADPFGGVILTDWYSPPNTPSERFKVNIYILDRQLRADGVRAAVFRQARDNSGSWRDTQVGPDTGTQLENTILTRARQLRIAQAGTS